MSATFRVKVKRKGSLRWDHFCNVTEEPKHDGDILCIRTHSRIWWYRMQDVACWCADIERDDRKHIVGASWGAL